MTSRFLEKVAKRYLLILRRSSHLGGPRALSLLDSVAFLWIRLCDIRTKNRVVRGLLALENKWLSFFLGAAAAVLVDRFFKK